MPNYVSQLSMWTIYDHPKDFPKHYIARRWQIDGAGLKATSDLLFDDDLDGLRRQVIATGHDTAIARNESDDLCIIETWM